MPEKYIVQAGKKWRVRVPQGGEGDKRLGGRFPTLESAIIARDAILADMRHPPTEVPVTETPAPTPPPFTPPPFRLKIQAQTPHNPYTAPTPVTPPPTPAPVLTAPMPPKVSEEVVWQQAIANSQRNLRDHATTTQRRQILLPNVPVAIALLSDQHLGDPYTDHAAAKADAEVVRDTDGMFAFAVGDAINNWIIGKLQALQRKEIVSYDWEVMLLDSYLGILANKLLVMVSGNHELWTLKSAGVDLLRAYTTTRPLIYDTHHIGLDLIHGTTTRRVLVRHKWRGNSIYNPYHGLMTTWERGGEDYDIAIGGHTHIGTLFADFVKHGEVRLAALIGTYKQHDTFGVEIGFAPTHGRGCGALVLHPDGRMFHTSDLATARDLLRTWQSDFAVTSFQQIH